MLGGVRVVQKGLRRSACLDMKEGMHMPVRKAKLEALTGECPEAWVGNYMPNKGLGLPLVCRSVWDFCLNLETSSQLAAWAGQHESGV